MRPQEIKRLTEQEVKALFAEYERVVSRRLSRSLSPHEFDKLTDRKAYLESVLEHPDLPVTS